MKTSILKIVTVIMIIMWMTFIFYMSAKPANASNYMSDGVSYRIVSTADNILGWNMSESEKLEKAETIHYPVRKCAHMTEYAILAILLLIYMGCCEKVFKDKEKVLIVMVIVMAYACTDEFHQLFVPGRSGQITDVCIDTVGGVAGSIAYILIQKGVERKRRK